MKIGIVIPWRPQPSRLETKKFIVKHYKEMFPDAKIYFADKKGEKWNISGSRNLGCDKAIADGCDVIVVSDADLYVKKDRILDACQTSMTQGIVSNPYGKIVFLDNKDSSLFMADQDGFFEDTKELLKVYPALYGGVYTITPSTFKELNGWDERFSAWGFEDLAFRDAHRKITGLDFYKTGGLGVWLGHEDRDKSLASVNEKLYNNFYKTLSKNELADWIKGNRFELL